MGRTRALVGTATIAVASLLLAGCSSSVGGDPSQEATDGSAIEQTDSQDADSQGTDQAQEPAEPHAAAHIKAHAIGPGRDTMAVESDYGLDFGVGVNGVKVWMVAVVNDQGYEIGDLATAHFELRDKEGNTLSSAKESQRFWTGQNLIFPMYMKLPEGIEARSAHVDVVVEKDKPNTPAPDERAKIEVKSKILSTIGDEPVIAFTLKNDSDLTAAKSRVDVICYDERDRIIGGGQAVPPPITSKQSIGLHAELITTGKPESCELFPAVLQSQDPADQE